MQILGLHWVGGNAATVNALGKTLIAAQHADGGWGQNRNLASDAYATGETLYALKESGVLSSLRPGLSKGREVSAEPRSAKTAPGTCAAVPRNSNRISKAASPSITTSGFPPLPHPGRSGRWLQPSPAKREHPDEEDACPVAGLGVRGLAPPI